MNRLFFCSIALVLVACSAESRGPFTEGESEGALSDDPPAAAPASFELIQEGAFSDRRTDLYVPRAVHIGFANARGGPWEGARDIDITYSNEKNEALKIDVPTAHRSKRLMLYSVRYDTYRPNDRNTPRTGWLSDLAVRLAAPKGRFITAPISGGSGYPFSPECYNVHVQSESFPGKLRGIIYGFTKSSKSDYESNNDVPWQNIEAKATHEGFLKTEFQHDGGYKGSYVARPIWVRVPEGTSLVFKGSLKRFGGICIYGDDTIEIPPPDGQDSHLTKTYFEDVN